MNLKVSVFAVIFTISLQIFAQKVQSITTEFDGERVIITYDLVAGKPDQKFNVFIKSSHDNYAKTLKFLMGDAGSNVQAGNRNRVIWDVKNELPSDFNGSIILKIEAEVVKPIVEKVALNLKPLEKNAFKRNENLRVDWVGGPDDNNLKVELFKDNTLYQKLGDVTGSQMKSYYWKIPKKMKKGDYFIRMTNNNETSENDTTQLFKVKPRTPLLVKLLPVAAVGGAAYLVLGGGKDEEADLPVPIGPPDN